MKSSVFLVAASAILATASPLRKRVMETKWVVEVVTVTVTADASPTAGVYVKNAAHAVPTTPAPAPPQATPAPLPAPPKVEVPVAAPPPVVVKPQPEVKPVPKPAPKPQPDTGNLGGYEGTMLKQHNIHRSNHSAPALAWDSTLAQYAENTAKGCVFKHDMDQGQGGYGQNLASWGSTGNIDDMHVKAAAQGVTNQWYNSEMTSWEFYGQSNPPSSSSLHDWGHFTQVVWKSSTKVGCFTAKCPAGTVLSFPSWYTVCNYNPPGNFGGQYGKNVLEPLGENTFTV